MRVTTVVKRRIGVSTQWLDPPLKSLRKLRVACIDPPVEATAGFCGNTGSRHGLGLRDGLDPTLTWGNASDRADENPDGGAEGPDASFSRGPPSGRRGPGGETEESDGDQEPGQQRPDARSGCGRV